MFINPTANIPLACSDWSHLHVNGITLQFIVVLIFQCSREFLNWPLFLFSERFFRGLIVWLLFLKIRSPKKHKSSLRKPWVSLNWLSKKKRTLMCSAAIVPFPVHAILFWLLLSWNSCKGNIQAEERGVGAGQTLGAIRSWAFVTAQVGLLSFWLLPPSLYDPHWELGAFQIKSKEFLLY